MKAIVSVKERDVVEVAPIRLEILELLARHRVVTVRQAHRFVGLSAGFKTMRTVQRHLQEMCTVGLVDYVQKKGSSQERRYFLTEAGVGLVHKPEQASHCTRQTAAGAQAAHLEAVVEMGSLMAQAASEWPNDEFAFRDFQQEVEFSYGPNNADVVRADAVMTYKESGEKTVFHVRILEIDRGTEPIGTLAEKVSGYVRWCSYQPPKRPGGNDRHLAPHQWQRDFPALMQPPRVCFVFADLGINTARTRMEQLAAMTEDNGWSRHVRVEATSLSRLQKAATEPRWGPFYPGTTRGIEVESGGIGPAFLPSNRTTTIIEGQRKS